MTKINLRFSIATMLLSFGFLSLNPLSAGANTLVSTSPISGSTVSVSPTNVTITGQLPLLADAVDANVITVKDPNGDRVDDGTISISDLSASVGVKSLVVTGMYRVSYSLLSEGDEPLVGEFSFKYLAPSNIAPIEPSPEPTQSQSPASSSWATNVFVILLLFGAVIVTIGLSLYARKLFSER
jgi:methionine-rich copper-binding protein CopC